VRKALALFLFIFIGISMGQIARPNSDISVGGWSPYPADPTTLWDKIDEVTPNGDTDYIVSSTDEDECELNLTAVIDPEVGTGHKIRCYAKSPAGGGAAEQMYISLVENGTERARSATENVNRNAYGLIEYTLSEAEANSIGNYGNLRIRARITKTDADEPIRITQFEFECPSAPAQTISPDAIASLEVFGSHTVKKLLQDLHPDGIASLESFGVPASLLNKIKVTDWKAPGTVTSENINGKVLFGVAWSNPDNAKFLTELMLHVGRGQATG